MPILQLDSVQVEYIPLAYDSLMLLLLLKTVGLKILVPHEFECWSQAVRRHTRFVRF
jgi:hypothetical protein